ncbi:MAG: hypothetical protein CMP26_08205 [Roseibacillus sp.]|nr:hypothetical protein [Roseibacillus sp.]
MFWSSSGFSQFFRQRALSSSLQTLPKRPREQLPQLDNRENDLEAQINTHFLSQTQDAAGSHSESISTHKIIMTHRQKTQFCIPHALSVRRQNLSAWQSLGALYYSKLGGTEAASSLESQWTPSE